MTDELKFYDPETGAELHRAPEGATIPRGMPYGFIENGVHRWRPRGSALGLCLEDDIPRFTREPIAQPKPPLPTEPGATIRAVHQSGDECAVMVRGKSGHWHGVDQDGDERFWGDKSIASWEPVSIVPTETWDRLRVLDPEGTRDRVDAHGGVWRYGGGRGCWEREDGTFLYCLEVVDRHYGPLRFADEVSGDA